jgi:hypothetical protein
VIPPSEADGPNILGPIGGKRVTFTGGAGTCGGQVTYNYQLLDGNGVWQTISSSFLARGWLPETDFEIVSLTRLDGLPDDCGDPPGVVNEYNDYSQTVSITYEDNTQTEVTEDVDITLGPLIVGIGGVVYAPVTVGTGDITLNGTVELSPEFSVELFPNGLFGGGGDTEGPIPEPGQPDPAPTSPNERRRIIGAVVTVTALDQDIFQGTQIAQGDTPDLLVPRVGNISFYVESSGGLAWTEPIAVKTVRAYIPCPAREGAVDVGFTPETGVTADVKPVYVDLSVAD